MSVRRNPSIVVERGVPIRVALSRLRQMARSIKLKNAGRRHFMSKRERREFKMLQTHKLEKERRGRMRR